MEQLNKDFLVVQSNALIEKKRSLTIDEQKLVLIFASLIKKDDEEFKVYEVEANKIMDLLEVKNQSKYTALKEVLRNLSKKSIEYDDGKGFDIIQWFSKATYRNGILKVRFDEDLKPFLLGLKEYFTKYKLENVLHMKSKYSIQLYELLKSNSFKKELELSIDELRELFNTIDKYQKYNHFKERTILKAQEEINNKTDINFEFEEIKIGRKVDKIKFIIKSKKIYETEGKTEDTNGELDPVIQANIQTLKALFNIDISEKDILNILDAANKDMAKVISKYYLIKDKKDIKNFTGLLIDSIKEDYCEIAVSKENHKPEIKTKFHNLSEERFKKYSREEFEKIAIEKNRKKFNR